MRCASLQKTEKPFAAGTLLGLEILLLVRYSDPRYEETSEVLHGKSKHQTPPVEGGVLLRTIILLCMKRMRSMGTTRIFSRTGEWGELKLSYRLAFKLFNTVFADIVLEYPWYQVSFSVIVFYVRIFGILLSFKL